MNFEVSLSFIADSLGHLVLICAHLAERGCLRDQEMNRQINRTAETLAFGVIFWCCPIGFARHWIIHSYSSDQAYCLSAQNRFATSTFGRNWYQNSPVCLINSYWKSMDFTQCHCTIINIDYSSCAHSLSAMHVPYSCWTFRTYWNCYFPKWFGFYCRTAGSDFA